MEDLIQVDGRYYVSATSSRVDDRTRVLKHGDSFAVFDRYGDIQIVAGTQGLFHAGTRHLSRFELLLEDTRPILLNSTVKNDNTLLTVDLTNPDLRRGKSDYLLQDNIHFCAPRPYAKASCMSIYAFKITAGVPQTCYSHMNSPLILSIYSK